QLRFYILISEMAPHYENIRKHGELSLMLIENEQDAKSIFFRKRVNYYCKISFAEMTEDLKNKFVARQGAATHTMLGMDFHIVECRPQRSGLVLGPGKAYHICGSEITQDTGPAGKSHGGRAGKSS
ncbi:MAG: hypothetical protein AAF975_04615, partial [Spirochaetota bacterium]